MGAGGSVSTEGSFFLVRPGLGGSGTPLVDSVLRGGPPIPVEALAEMDVESRTPLALGSSGEGMLRMREGPGWRRGAMRRLCS